MKLDILCQSPINDAISPTQAIHNTVDLAVQAEQLGFHRFWVAEHHSDPSLAGASPEIMATHIAARTERIRIGTGGVLLPFYQPFKVAEQFRLLAALHPGRIDLGIGRSGGSEGQAPSALAPRPRDHWAAMDELLAWLSERGPLPGTHASPASSEPPTPWVLGTSPSSATYAGRRGLPYAFGGFLDPRGLSEALMAYHSNFQPSTWAERPRVNLAWTVLAAPTEEQAWDRVRSLQDWFVKSILRGSTAPFAHPDRIDGSYGPMEQMALHMHRQFAVVGDPIQVRDGLLRLVEQTRADELTLVTIPYHHHERLESYQLVAEALGANA